jgi:Tfp pilus assembly protein PilZ
MPGALKVTVVVPEPGAVKDRVYPNGKLGGLTIDGPKPGALGQRVTVTVKVQKPAREFSFVGQLAWARHKSSSVQDASYGVDFLAGDDPTWARLLAFSTAQLKPEEMRFEHRLTVQLAVRVVHLGQTRRETLADLSYGGAFIRTWNPLPVGEWVELVTRPPLSLTSVRMRGRVAWSRLTGDDPGMGVAFFDADGKQTPVVRKLVEKLTARAG